MTNKLEISRELTERLLSGCSVSSDYDELRALLAEPQCSEINPQCSEVLRTQKVPPIIQTLRANGDRIAMEATIAQQAQRIADLEQALAEEKSMYEASLDRSSILADAFHEQAARIADLERGRGEPVAWSYCPECGCEELHHEEGEHKQCANCHQEWFSDLDYSEVVRGNLARLKAEQPAPVAVVNLRNFANAMIDIALEGCDADGAQIQELAVEHGLLKPEQRTERCSDACSCAEYADFPVECFRKVDELNQSRAS